MSEGEFLMLVSARAGADVRADAGAGRRPCPDHLRLEERGVRLLDWSSLGWEAGGRSATRSLLQVRAALRIAGRFRAILSDGEPVGLPLAAIKALLGLRFPHVMIGHRLTTPAKRPFFRLGAGRGLDRVVVHCRRQLEAGRTELGLPDSRLALVHYGVDTDFWRPLGRDEERLVVAAGREHRDYATLAHAALTMSDARFFITRTSAHSQGARCAEPATWPANLQLGSLEYTLLRELYARASVVAVPLLATDFQAGITAVLEGMAMGKALVVSATEGLRDLLVDGETALLVPPGDAGALAGAVRRLLEQPELRRRLGRRAREVAEAEFALDAYAGRLAALLEEVARPAAEAMAAPGGLA